MKKIVFNVRKKLKFKPGELPHLGICRLQAGLKATGWLDKKKQIHGKDIGGWQHEGLERRLYNSGSLNKNTPINKGWSPLASRVGSVKLYMMPYSEIYYDFDANPASWDSCKYGNRGSCIYTTETIQSLTLSTIARNNVFGFRLFKSMDDQVGFGRLMMWGVPNKDAYVIFNPRTQDDPYLSPIIVLSALNEIFKMSLSYLEWQWASHNPPYVYRDYPHLLYRTELITDFKRPNESCPRFKIPWE